VLQYWPAGVLLGGVALLRERTRLGMLFLLGLAGEWFFVVSYDVVDWADFMHPVYILFAPLLALGLGQLWQWLVGQTERWQAVGRRTDSGAVERWVTEDEWATMEDQLLWP